MKHDIILKDSATGEVLVIAPLSKTRMNALVKAYSRAGIEAVLAQSLSGGEGFGSLPCLMSKGQTLKDTQKRNQKNERN